MKNLINFKQHHLITFDMLAALLVGTLLSVIHIKGWWTYRLNEKALTFVPALFLALCAMYAGLFALKKEKLLRLRKSAQLKNIIKMLLLYLLLVFLFTFLSLVLDIRLDDFFLALLLIVSWRYIWIFKHTIKLL